MSLKISSHLKKLGISALAVTGVLFLMQARVEWPQRSTAAVSGSTAGSGGKYWTEKTESEKKSGQGIDAAALNKTFISLAETSSPAVVNIYTKSRMPVRRFAPGGGSQEDLFRFFFGNPFGEPPEQQQPREAQSLGSGFVINASSGLIVTNSHVVRPTGRNADSVLIKFNSDSEKSEGHPATIVGVDESTDVAILRLKNVPKDLKATPLGNSDNVKVGEWVVAIGNPYGHSHSVTKGIVSALGRNINEGLSTLQRANFIQTDASINPGNSGGPLINLYGEVIGINTAIDARAQGIGFAIPINVAKSVVTQILEKGQVTLGWIGVGLSDLSPQIAKSLKLPDSDGAFIQEVMPRGPADKGGMLSYDVVREINGKKITSDRDLWQIVSGAAPGTQLNFKIYRDGKEKSLNVTVAARPSEKELAKRQGREQEDETLDEGTPGKFIGKTGLSVVELSGEIKRRLRLDQGARGAVVHRVDPEGPAALIGIQPGDVIVEVDRKPVKNAFEVEKALSAKKDSFLVRITRGTASVIVLLDVSGK